MRVRVCVCVRVCVRVGCTDKRLLTVKRGYGEIVKAAEKMGLVKATKTETHSDGTSDGQRQNKAAVHSKRRQF